MANDPNTIQYVIQEDGFWYVASKDRTPGVPEITVSAKGVANGLSEEYNDGWDFGPDTYNPSVTSGVPLTQTNGIVEALNYAQSNLEMYFPPQFSSPVRPIYYNVKKVKLMPGLFKITAPITMQFYGGYNGYATYLPNILEGSGPLATFIMDATSSGLSNMITTNSYTGSYISNQEVSQENFNYIGNFSLVANNNNTQYGLNMNIGDGPPHATIEHINFIGNFTQRALWYNSDESFIHYLSFFNTNNTINATILANGGVAYADHLYASGYNYLNLEVGGSEVYISDSLINSLKIGSQSTDNPLASAFGSGDIFIENSWFGNNSGIGYTIGIFNSLTSLHIKNTHLKTFATSTTASDSPPAFYLGYAPSSSPAFNTLSIRSYDLNAYQNISGAVTMLSQDTSGNEWLLKQFSHIDAHTDFSGYAIQTSEFSTINGKWVPQIITNGTTAGTVTQLVLENQSGYKKVMFYFNGYENDTTTNQSIDFIYPFATIANVSANTTGLTISATTSGSTITAPDSTTTYSGIVIVEGY